MRRPLVTFSSLRRETKPQENSLALWRVIFTWPYVQRQGQRQGRRHSNRMKDRWRIIKAIFCTFRHSCSNFCCRYRKRSRAKLTETSYAVRPPAFLPDGEGIGSRINELSMHFLVATYSKRKKKTLVTSVIFAISKTLCSRVAKPLSLNSPEPFQNLINIILKMAFLT